MDSSAELSDSLFVQDSYLKLAQSLGIFSPLPATLDTSFVVRQKGGASHQDALTAALELTNVDLGTSRVRVGISRGHLFEIVVQVPLDVAGNPDALQLTVEEYFEARFGEQLLDEWVACISVDRIARTRGLMMLSDVSAAAEHHPLESSLEILHHGIDQVVAELPQSLLSVSSSTEDWVALHIPPCDSALQPERCFASTRFPEALKCALEGMPFSSRRFTRGPEAFGWLSWAPKGPNYERLKMRERVENIILQAQKERGILFAGSGFGAERDYADVWVLLEEAAFPQLLSDLALFLRDLEFGLYDSPFQRYPLRIREMTSALE